MITNRPVVIPALGINALIRGEISDGVYEVVYDYEVKFWSLSQVLGLIALEQSWSIPKSA